ncbi:hypothetical protein Anapl_14450 [Anas platyrhynchos]|uniref:Uncharacterized protein n=1 Tax=Anas platyrhynchos TaxID=8839 RepID=R0L829_ANAPL|nr:hypothetical protein Anapl_14450 [Anas platyrhynchos]
MNAYMQQITLNLGLSRSPKGIVSLSLIGSQPAAYLPRLMVAKSAAYRSLCAQEKSSPHLVTEPSRGVSTPLHSSSEKFFEKNCCGEKGIRGEPALKQQQVLSVGLSNGVPTPALAFSLADGTSQPALTVDQCGGQWLTSVIATSGTTLPVRCRGAATGFSSELLILLASPQASQHSIRRQRPPSLQACVGELMFGILLQGLTHGPCPATKCLPPLKRNLIAPFQWPQDLRPWMILCHQHKDFYFQRGPCPGIQRHKSSKAASEEFNMQDRNICEIVSELTTSYSNFEMFCAQAKHPLFKYSVKDFLLLLMPGPPVPIMHSYQQVLALWEIVHKNTSSMSGIWGLSPFNSAFVVSYHLKNSVHRNSKGALYPQKTDTEQISHKTKTVGLGTEGSQVDYFKRNYLLLSVFSDKKEDLAVLAFGSLLPVVHSFSFLVLHLLPLVGPAKESSCGRTCGSFMLPIGSL